MENRYIVGQEETADTAKGVVYPVAEPSLGSQGTSFEFSSLRKLYLQKKGG